MRLALSQYQSLGKVKRGVQMATFQFTALQRLLGQEVRTVAYYDGVGLASAVGQDITDDWRDYFNTHLRGQLVEEWAFYGGLVRLVSSPGQPSIEFTPTAGAVVGALSADPLPTQVAGLVSYRAESGRPNQARDYFCGFGEGSSNVTGQINASTLSAMVDMGAATLEVTVGITPLPRVSAEWNDNRTQVVESNALSVVRASNVWATQRRRRLFVGI